MFPVQSAPVACLLLRRLQLGVRHGYAIGGFELAFLLPPIMWLRRQRSRRIH